MAILKGFPPSNKISPTIRIPMACVDCKDVGYHASYNADGGINLPMDNSQWVYLCEDCARYRRNPSKHRNYWLDRKIV